MATAEWPVSMQVAVALWVGCVGAVIGSFLNVVVARVPAGESIVRPGSRCPRCRTPIAWYDNVPVVSFLVLRARCRACGARISVRYPLVELAGMAIAVLAWHRHGLSGGAAAELAYVAVLLALALIDLDTWLLPHVLTWPLTAAGILLAAFWLTPARSLGSALVGAAVGFVAFYGIAFVGEKLLRKEAMGMGDVWLVAGLGAWNGASALLPIVLLASIQGSVVGVVLMALGRAQPGPPVPGGDPAAEGDAPPAHGADDAEAVWIPPRNAVPFGPFLVAGALEWLYASEALARLAPALGLFR